jgi:hypothetical protein
MPQGVNGRPYAHNATRISKNKRQAIVLALANGEGVVATARRLRTSEHIVHAVRDQDWQDLARHKAILMAQAERNALEAGEQISEALQARKFAIGSLPVVYGISIDKVVSLAPPPQDVTSQHLHLHLAPQDIAGTFNSMLANLQQRTRSLRDAQASNDPTPQPIVPDATDTPVSSDDTSVLAKQPRSVPKKAAKSGSS